MHHKSTPQADKSGFIMVSVMFFIFIMMLLGITSAILSSSEKDLAGIERHYKATFYMADSGTNLAAELLEQNLNCPNGFTGNTNGGVDSLIEGVVYVSGTTESSGNKPDGKGSRNFAYNEQIAIPSDDNRDFSFPVEYDLFSNPAGYHPIQNPKGLHTNVTVGGKAVHGIGGSINMAAGYEGQGTGAAAGGTHINYEIMAESKGLINSRSIVWMGWRHVIGTEKTCKY